MRTESFSITLLFFLLASGIPAPVWAQEKIYQLKDVIDLPAVLHSRQSDSCLMEFSEQWTIDAAACIISKIVSEYGITCVDGAQDFSPSEETRRIKDITYEFSFLDPHHTEIKGLQADIIALIENRYPVNKIYNMPAQLLSVYFHEEWVFESAPGKIRKKVKGITPVIWQQRQTTEGQPVNDGESGLPVYYIQKLHRIDLRQP